MHACFGFITKAKRESCLTPFRHKKVRKKERKKRATYCVQPTLSLSQAQNPSQSAEDEEDEDPMPDFSALLANLNRPDPPP